MKNQRRGTFFSKNMLYKFSWDGSWKMWKCRRYIVFNNLLVLPSARVFTNVCGASGHCFTYHIVFFKHSLVAQAASHWVTCFLAAFRLSSFVCDRLCCVVAPVPSITHLELITITLFTSTKTTQKQNIKRYKSSHNILFNNASYNWLSVHCPSHLTSQSLTGSAPGQTRLV